MESRTENIVKKEPKDISVWLDDENHTLQEFRCVRCGRIVCEHYGDVDMIISGQHDVKRPKVILCHARRDVWTDGVKHVEVCNTRYFFS